MKSAHSQSNHAQLAYNKGKHENFDFPSETLDAFRAKEAESKKQASPTTEPFSNSLGDLKKNIEYLIGMERQSGSMEVISPLYVSRMLNVPLEDVEKVMGEMGVV